MKSINDFEINYYNYENSDYKTLINKMKDLYYYDLLHTLTLDAVIALEGKEIEIISFGYAHQDTYDKFVVGGVKEVEDGRLILLDSDNNHHFINLDKGDDAFWIGDTGRNVYYFDVKDGNRLFDIYNGKSYVGSRNTLKEVKELVNDFYSKESDITVTNFTTGVKVEFNNDLKLWDFATNKK